MTSLNTQAISQDVLAEKYLAAGEQTAEDLFRRVSQALADQENPELRAEWAERFFKNMQAGAIGASRIMAKAGLSSPNSMLSEQYEDKSEEIKDYFYYLTCSLTPHRRMEEQCLRRIFYREINGSCGRLNKRVRTGFFSSLKHDEKNMP